MPGGAARGAGANRLHLHCFSSRGRTLGNSFRPAKRQNAIETYGGHSRPGVPIAGRMPTGHSSALACRKMPARGAVELSREPIGERRRIRGSTERIRLGLSRRDAKGTARKGDKIPRLTVVAFRAK